VYKQWYLYLNIHKHFNTPSQSNLQPAFALSMNYTVYRSFDSMSCHIVNNWVQIQPKEPKTMSNSGEHYEHFYICFFSWHFKIILIIPSCA
jgi:hypothetical protein